MAKKKDQNQVKPEQILEALDPENWSFTSDIADSVGRTPMSIVEVMKLMRAQGHFEIRMIRGRTAYRLAPVREIAGPRYQAPKKPLTGYDPGALMRLCNGGRNAETGMA